MNQSAFVGINVLEPTLLTGSRDAVGSVNSDDYPKAYFYRRIVQAKLYIDKHFADKIDLNAISGEACFSKFHFIRSFRDIYGKTPHQYLIIVRINKARELISQGHSLAEVSLAVGFEEPASFSKVFKRHVGLRPSHFLASNLERNKQLAEAPLRFVPHCFALQFGLSGNK